MKNPPLPSKNISNRPLYCNMIRYLFQSVFFLPEYIFLESAKLRTLRAKNVLTCQRVLRAHVPTCLACLCAHVPTCLACLLAYVPPCLACLRAHVPTCLACSSANVLVLMSLFSVSLPLLLKLHTLLIRFKSLITVFPQ